MKCSSKFREEETTMIILLHIEPILEIIKLKKVEGEKEKSFFGKRFLEGCLGRYYFVHIINIEKKNTNICENK